MALGTCGRKVGMKRDQVLCYGLFDIDLAANAICCPRWLAEGQSGPMEKNWMPAVSPAGIHVVYACGPTVTLGLDATTGRLSMASSRSAPLPAWRFRGGSQLIPLGDGWIAIVHEAVDHARGDRTYLHRIVRFGPDFSITHYSLPFRLRGEMVEYVAGLARSRDRLLVTYAVGERAAIAASVPEASLLSLLLPLAEIAPGGPQPGRVPEADTLTASVHSPTGLFDMANSLHQDGWHEAAVTAFRHCARVLPDDLTGARAAFRAALILGNELGRWDEAVDACADGMARVPDLVDLY
ncbi:MAG: hypothetical protein ACKOWF_11970 [Chloroflexota bacterium]